jgi:hypothetical protein
LIRKKQEKKSPDFGAFPFYTHEVSDQAIRQLDLIYIKLGSCVTCIQWYDLLDQIVLMIVEDLDVKVTDQVQIYLVTVVADTHDKRSPFVQNLDLFVK